MSQAGSLEALHTKYRDRAEFLVVYIREAHASDSDFPIRRGPKITDPKTLQERIEVATKCRKAIQFSMPMLIDELNDHVARDYGGFPDQLYVVGKDGRVAYRGPVASGLPRWKRR